MDTMAIRRQLLHFACRPAGPSTDVEWVQVVKGSPWKVPVLTSSAQPPGDWLIGVPGDVSRITVAELRRDDVVEALMREGLGVLAWCTWGTWHTSLAPGHSRGMLEADAGSVNDARRMLAVALDRMPDLDRRHRGDGFDIVGEIGPGSDDPESMATVWWRLVEGQQGLIEAKRTPSGGWEEALDEALSMARRLHTVADAIWRGPEVRRATRPPVAVASPVPGTTLWWADHRDLFRW